MRKITILFAMAAIVAAVCSCNQNGYQETSDEGTDGLSFVLKGIETRSDYSAPLASYTYRLGTGDDGTIYNLEETVTELGDVGAYAPETKGTPVYTENVQSVFGNSFNGVVYGSSGSVAGDGAFEATDGVWRRVFGYNPFERSNPLTFFLRMPATQQGVSNLAYNVTDPSISFDYTSPTAPADQKDIIFAIRQLDETTYQRELKSNGGASVLFRHALTGVKFAIGNNTIEGSTIKTYIKKVVIKGLKNSGSAKFVPAGTETVEDNRTEFSSAGSFTWTLGSTTGTFTQTYSESNVVDYTSGDGVGGPSSFYAAGANDNLNDNKASLTFWFIPQEITEDLTVTVTFYVKDGNNKGSDLTLDLDLGTRILASSDNSDINGEWKAGQLRTFSLKPTTVDVDITDDVTGDVKKNVVTRNTGNKNVWMRVAFVGNWVNNAGEIVAPWYETQGTFTGLGGDGTWAKGDDGFWYYKSQVAPGGTPSKPIFLTYTRPTSGLPEGATKLIMDVTVQAIDYTTGRTYAEAWASVLGSDDGIPVPGDDDSGSGE